MRPCTGPRRWAAIACRWAPARTGSKDFSDRPPIWNNWRHVQSTRQRLHRQGRFPSKRRYRLDARPRGVVPGRPRRRPRLAIPAGRRQPRRTGRGCAVPRTQGGNRPRSPGCRGAGLDPRMAALSTAAPIRARSLHRPEATLVSLEAHAPTTPSCASTAPASRSSIAGAGSIIGRRCARSSISSGGSTCVRCTNSAS